MTVPQFANSADVLGAPGAADALSESLEREIPQDLLAKPDLRPPIPAPRAAAALVLLP